MGFGNKLGWGTLIVGIATFLYGTCGMFYSAHRFGTEVPQGVFRTHRIEDRVAQIDDQLDSSIYVSELPQKRNLLLEGFTLDDVIEPQIESQRDSVQSLAHEQSSLKTEYDELMKKQNIKEGITNYEEIRDRFDQYTNSLLYSVVPVSIGVLFALNKRDARRQRREESRAGSSEC